MSAPATEPVRRNLYPAAAVSALVALSSTLAVAAEITLQVGFGAVAAAAGAFGAVAFAAEHARSQVYSPATANEIMDADAIISQAEAEGRA
jgi:uncharacterized PurR-regulated membrane protein YhhQ (DUF165 family)